MDWKKLKIVLKLSKNKHAGAIAGRSTRPGAFYQKIGRYYNDTKKSSKLDTNKF